MKKQIYLTALILSIVIISNAQDYIKEKVDWFNSTTYAAKDILFESNGNSYECKNCRYLEIKTESGVTGIFVLGEGILNLKKRNLTDSIHACLIRFNPADMNSLLTISNKDIVVDKGFTSICLYIINDVFRHCYHSGMDAILPNPGDYALNVFSKTYGDLLASFADKKMSLYSFTERKVIK